MTSPLLPTCSVEFWNNSLADIFPLTPPPSSSSFFQILKPNLIILDYMIIFVYSKNLIISINSPLEMLKYFVPLILLLSLLGLRNLRKVFDQFFKSYCCKGKSSLTNLNEPILTCMSIDAPFNVQDDPKMGRHWVATRDLEMGSTLLEECPLFFGPRWTQNNFNGPPNCLTCGKYMEEKSDQKCKNCHWPICSTECGQMEIHGENECKIFAQQKIPYPPPPRLGLLSPSEFCDCVAMLRGVGLRNQNLSKFHQLMELQDNFVLPNFDQSLHHSAQQAVQKLMSLAPSLPNSCVEEFKKLFRIMTVNSFGGSLNDGDGPNHHDDYDQYDGEESKIAHHIYLKASRLNSSCVPNCCWSIGPFPSLKIRIRTTTQVKQGQQLTITYTHLNGELDTLARQTGLRTGYGFICQCARCLDPTELGTFVSAITCPFCQENGGPPKVGYFLPLDPLNLNSNDDGNFYQCDQCQLTRPYKELVPLVQLLSMQLEYGQRQDEGEGRQKRTFIKKKDAREIFFKKFIQNYAGPALHPNHWIVRNAQRELVKIQMSRKKLLTLRELRECIKYCENLLHLQDKVNPGLSEARVLTLRTLSTIVLTLLTRFGSKAFMSPQEVCRWAKFCTTLQTEALLYFQLDKEDDKAVMAAKRLMEEIELAKKYLHNNSQN